MPDERLIAQIENILSDVVQLGGANELTSIVPNLIVQDANPTGLDGFVIVSDGRDGDNITARKLGSIVYADNDSVNVLFVKGAEAIAYQQGSQSANSGMWEKVPATSTDIFYDKGDVGIANAAPLVALEVGDLNATFAAINNTPGGTIAAGGTTSGRLYLEGSASADIILDDSGGAANEKMSNLVNVGGLTKFRLFNDVGSVKVDNVLVIDNTDGRIGIGTSSPDAKFEVLDTAGAQFRITFEDGVKYVDLTVDTNHDLTIAPSSDGIVLVDSFLSVNIGVQDYQLRGRAGASSLQFEAQNPGSPSIFEMFTKDGDGTDIVGIRLHAVGTTTSVANRERLQIQWNTLDTFEILTEAQGTGTLRPLRIYTEGNTDQIRLAIDGRVGIGTASPSAKLHVDQASTVAAIPALYLDQADISEEMVEFNTTIGVGNAIEAVGAKTLTVTHFIKCTLPGGLTRYWPVGTIA